MFREGTMRTELIIGAQHAMKLPAISQDDEHLS
jgi:hypothetical protein